MPELKNEVILFSPQIETFVPFAGYVDSSRLNMTSKQLLQSVIGPNTETPLVIDKHFKKMTNINSLYTEYAQEDGHIIFSSNETILIYYPVLKKLVTKMVPPVKKMINNALSLKYKAEVGPIKKNDLLCDYTNLDTDTLLPKLGYRANIMFASFFGYTADDAIVISESFANRATVEHYEKVYIPITKEWKYLRNADDTYFYKEGEVQPEEAYTKYFNIDMSDHFMAEIHNIGEQQSMFFTKSLPGIKEGTIVKTKVHRNTDKTFDELKEKYLYTPGLIQELESIYYQDYKVFLGTQQVLTQMGVDQVEANRLAEELFESYYSTKTFPKLFETKLKDDFGLEPENVDFLLEVTVLKEVPTTRGDKFTNLFAGKGIVSMIIPDSIMPKDPDTGLPIDIIFNPLGIFGRNNWGSIFELSLSKIINEIQVLANESSSTNNKVEDIINRIRFINNNFIIEYDKEYYDDINKLINIIVSEEYSGEVTGTFIDDIKLKGFYLYAPNFIEIPYNKFYDNFIKEYANKFKLNILKSDVSYSKELMGWLRDKWHYKNNIIGEEARDVDVNAFVGMNYILKLYHTSYSKYTSVSLANSYSKITGQPARGRKKSGGQHVSWQTLAALLGHKEKNGILKELYTIKSDAPLKDKEKFLMEYIIHGRYNLKPKYVSLTKRAINNSLKILGMQLTE